MRHRIESRYAPCVPQGGNGTAEPERSPVGTATRTNIFARTNPATLTGVLHQTNPATGKPFEHRALRDAYGPASPRSAPLPRRRDQAQHRPLRVLDHRDAAH